MLQWPCFQPMGTNWGRHGQYNPIPSSRQTQRFGFPNPCSAGTCNASSTFFQPYPNPSRCDLGSSGARRVGSTPSIPIHVQRKDLWRSAASPFFVPDWRPDTYPTHRGSCMDLASQCLERRPLAARPGRCNHGSPGRNRRIGTRRGACVPCSYGSDLGRAFLMDVGPKSASFARRWGNGPVITFSAP
jgi:hypothetical protein